MGPHYHPLLALQSFLFKVLCGHVGSRVQCVTFLVSFVRALAKVKGRSLVGRRRAELHLIVSPRSRIARLSSYNGDRDTAMDLQQRRNDILRIAAQYGARNLRRVRLRRARR